MRNLFTFFTLAFLLTLSTIIDAQVRMTGNPSCSDLSPAFNKGFKLEPPQSGTNIINGVGTVVTNVHNGKTLDWTNAPNFIGAVIVKGGTDSNVYYYNPLVAGATGLVSPDMNGSIPDLSHVEYCYNLNTTAAPVEFIGKVVNSDGYVVAGANVTLINGESGNQAVRTNQFGYFRFTNITAGSFVIVTVKAKGYGSKSASLSLLDDVTDYVIVLDGSR